MANYQGECEKIKVMKWMQKKIFHPIIVIFFLKSGGTAVGIKNCTGYILKHPQLCHATNSIIVQRKGNQIIQNSIFVYIIFEVTYKR